MVALYRLVSLQGMGIGVGCRISMNGNKKVGLGLIGDIMPFHKRGITIVGTGIDHLHIFQAVRKYLPKL